MTEADDVPESVETATTKMERLLAAADAAFMDDTAFDFPPQLHSLPARILELKPFVGLPAEPTFPLWGAVVTIDRKLPNLRLRQRLEELFERASQIPPGPLAKLWGEKRAGRLSPNEETELKILDQLLNSVPRNVNGHLEGKPVQLTFKGVLACQGLLRKHVSKIFQTLEARVLKADTATNDLLAYAAFLDFYCRSRDWMERYDQPLRELFKLGEDLEYTVVFDKLSHLLRDGKYPDADEMKRIQTKLRVQKHRSKNKGALPSEKKS